MSTPKVKAMYLSHQSLLAEKHTHTPVMRHKKITYSPDSKLILDNAPKLWIMVSDNVSKCAMPTFVKLLISNGGMHSSSTTGEVNLEEKMYLLLCYRTRTLISGMKARPHHLYFPPKSWERWELDVERWVWESCALHLHSSSMNTFSGLVDQHVQQITHFYT